MLEQLPVRNSSTAPPQVSLAGALVAKLTMEALDIRSADICPWALREGIILHYLQSTQVQSWQMPLHELRPAHMAFGDDGRLAGKPVRSVERAQLATLDRAASGAYAEASHSA